MLSVCLLSRKHLTTNSLHKYLRIQKSFNIKRITGGFKTSPHVIRNHQTNTIIMFLLNGMIQIILSFTYGNFILKVSIDYDAQCSCKKAPNRNKSNFVKEMGDYKSKQIHNSKEINYPVP